MYQSPKRVLGWFQRKLKGHLQENPKENLKENLRSQHEPKRQPLEPPDGNQFGLASFGSFWFDISTL